MKLRRCVFCGRFIRADVRWCDRNQCNCRFTSWRQVRQILNRWASK